MLSVNVNRVWRPLIAFFSPRPQLGVGRSFSRNVVSIRGLGWPVVRTGGWVALGQFPSPPG